MASTLKTLVQSLTPPPFINPVIYHGQEWKWRIFVLRPALLAQELRYEPYILLGVLCYLAFWIYGKSYNSVLANNWLDAHFPLFSEQFSRPTNNGLTSDGYSDYFNFSTGRRAVTSLHSVLTLRPRHDLFQLIYQTLKSLTYDLGYTPVDSLELDFKLSDDASVPDFVFAIVAKDQVKTIKTGRWDLTFTAIRDHPSLPPSLTVMSELADVTDSIFKLPVPVIRALAHPDILPYFRSLSITDQPRDRPSPDVSASPDRTKRVILSLVAPNPNNAAVTLPLVAATFELIDALRKISLRPETKVKLRKVREEISKQVKEEVSKEKKEEILESKREKKKKAEEDRISRLSAAEQKKVLERERKRATKKMQGKIVRK